jgi:diguanylate cyclase (GGDEF)-like protein
MSAPHNGDEFVFTDPTHEATLADIRKKLSHLEKRDWWLWGTAVSVLLLISSALFVVSLPTLLKEQDLFHSYDVEIAVHGLFGLVLLFSVFAIYQQLLIKRLRGHMAGQIGMMSALETRAEVFQKLAILDPLTGLFNRRFATEHLPVEIARAERQGYPFTLLMMDLNGFKQINDVHGHAAGDLALREFARELKKCIRSSDIPVRIGGDEFMVLMPECRAYSVPVALARLRGLVIQINGQEVPLTIVAGWAEQARDESPDELLQRADRALYEDKRTGRTAKHVQEAEADARQSEKMQIVGQMTGRVVHDFNNLLTVIKGYCELMISDVEVPDAARRKLEEIRKAALHAAQLIQQLIAFSRKQVLESKVVDLNAKVADMEGLVRPLLGARMNLVTRCAARLGHFRASAGQIEQIIMNLAVNARDAMSPGGTLTIETASSPLDADFVRTHPGSRIGNYVSIAVIDDGTGMDQQTQARIFEPYFTTKANGSGAGIGLSTVYGTVKQLGGYIDVWSEPGRGSRFTVYLPVFAEEMTVAPIAALPAAAEDVRPQGKHQHTVLVVESVESLRKLTCDFLKNEGYNFLEAESAAAALEIMNRYSGPIHVALTDVLLPGMSSRELAEALAVARPEIKMLYISGYADIAVTYDDVLRTGAFLETPFSPVDLTRKIRELVSQDAQRATVVHV